MRTLIGFGRPVSRTYTLSVASINIPAASANIQGWDATKGDWTYNEAPFVKFDKMLDLASKCKSLFLLPAPNLTPSFAPQMASRSCIRSSIRYSE